MSVRKTTIKIRSRGGDEEEIVLQPGDNPSTEPPYIDIKRNKRVAHERGRGRAYQKTVYSYIPQDEKARKYDETLTLKNPDDESQVIEYKKNVSSIRVESGRGRFYQAGRIKYDNSENNNGRQVRSKMIVNDEDGSRIEVERIDRYSIEHGRGRTYQGKRVFPKTQDEDLDD